MKILLLNTYPKAFDPDKICIIGISISNWVFGFIIDFGWEK